MWITVRIETPVLDTSVQISLAQLEAACVSQGSVSVQRHRTLSSVLTTRGFFFVPRQETKILVPYSSCQAKGSPGRKKKGWRGLDHALSAGWRHLPAIDSCHISGQCLAVPCALKQRRNTFLPYSCRGRGPLLLPAPVSPSDQNRIISLEDSKAAACASIQHTAHRIKRRMGSAVG